MINMEIKKYFKKSWHLLLQSFKQLDSRMFFIVLYDLLFFAISIFAAFIFGRILQNSSLGMQLVQLDQLTNMSKPELDNVLAVFQKFLYILIGGMILLAIIIFVLMCIFKALIWFTVANKQTTVKNIKKFLLINLIWFLAWIVPSVLIGFIIKQELLRLLIMIVVPLLMHFTNILYVLFTSDHHIIIIKKAFAIGIKKIHLFIIPYILSSAVLLLVSTLYWVYKFLPESAVSIIGFLIMLFYMAWSRKYFYIVIEDIKTLIK